MKKVEDFLVAEDPVLAFAAASAIAAGGKAPAKKAAGLEAKRKAALEDPRIASLMAEVASWPGELLSSHKSWNQGFQKLRFLVDLGFRAGDGGLEKVAAAILATVDGKGIPSIPFNISEAHGGSGKGGLAWALCDAPENLYSLSLLGLGGAKLEEPVAALAGLARGNGWPCAVSESLGTWRGPGKKADPCPFATLGMLKLLLLEPGKWKKEIALGTECLLGLWERSETEHPYIFYMGTDFRKLKFPFLWYDILSVVDALSRVPAVRKDPRFLEMVGIIDSKETEAGFIPESVYQACKDWDFGQKKQPSAWIGFAVASIRERL